MPALKVWVANERLTSTDLNANFASVVGPDGVVASAAANITVSTPIPLTTVVEGKASYLSGGRIVTSSAGVPATGWHHVVCTKNGATVKQYIDGADVTGTVTNATCVSVNNFVTIGGDTFGAGISEPFNGSLDEPAIYNRALSASEVLAHYNARNN